MGKRKLRQLLVFVGILFLMLILGVVYYGINHVAPYAILKPYRLVAKDHPKDFPQGIYPSNFGLDFDTIKIEVEKGIELKGYYVETPNPVRGSFIFLHGIGSCKEHWLEKMVYMTGLGFNCLMFDQRAHGESGGEFATYGFHEKWDVSRLIDLVESRAPGKPVGVWGVSYGGAVALQSMEADLRIRFGIVESTFTDLNQIVHDYQQEFIGFDLGFITDEILSIAGEIADFNPAQVVPAQSAQNITQPVLIIHGDEDKKIRFEYGREIYEKLAGPKKEWLPVAGGDHFNIWPDHRALVTEKIEAFLNSALGN